MNKNSTILNIAVPTPLRSSFDYLPPEDLKEDSALHPGMRVNVPFGRRMLTGILLSFSDKTEIPENKLRPIIEVIDKKPLIPEPLIKLANWASQYYHHSVGEVLSCMLPKLLRDGRPLEMIEELAEELSLIDHEQEQKEPEPDTQSNNSHSHDEAIKLNEHQIAALKSIKSAKGFQTFLLEGVTGSGKTEVYLGAIEDQLKKGKTALVLVPEIGLTPQTISRFQKRFPSNRIAVSHSKLTDRERALAWIKALKGNADIFIGTRSALFAPMPNLGIIILDEEHDFSFKQQRKLRYSARDLAVLRGKLENITVVLGSATPSLSSLYNARLNRYERLSLPERAGQSVLPSCEIIDLKKQNLKGGLSQTLLQKMNEHLDMGSQILLFLNRRGYAPLLLCHDCGWQALCTACDTPLTLHQYPSVLRCHHCEQTYPVYTNCPHCNGDLLQVGIGTQRLERTLNDLYPDKHVIRVDKNSVSRKGQLEQKLASIHKGEGDILIGTQMLAKGHHFPYVTLVAMIDADKGLFSLDFQAGEKLAQQIVQVSGRAGREATAGKVYLQTHYPDHPLLQTLLEEGYMSLAQKLLKEREDAKLPPYKHLALLQAEAIDHNKTLRFLDRIKGVAEDMNTYQGIVIEGPTAASMPKKANRHRTQLLFRSDKCSELQNFLSRLVPHIESDFVGRSVHWFLDVDPLEV